MEEFLMSSPTQLDDMQPPQHLDQNTADFGGDLTAFPYDQLGLAHLDGHVTQNYDAVPELLLRHSKHFSVDVRHLAAPGRLLDAVAGSSNSANVHAGSTSNSSSSFSGARNNFQHLRNVSLDDALYRVTGSSSSSGHVNPVFTHLALSNTLHSLELVPQLLLLALNPLILDLPYLAVTMTTPARRRKSTLVLSATFPANLYATPLRGQASPLAKIGKTPMKAMAGHRRTRLRLPELNLGQLLSTIASLMKSTAASGSYNPFEVQFRSPQAELSDFDQTPLTTPAKSYAGALALALYFTPVSHPHSFGGSLAELVTFVSSLDPNTLLASAGRTMPVLRRNDTLDLIHIEDQEDDACAQLRKAKSFNAVDRLRSGSGSFSASFSASSSSAAPAAGFYFHDQNAFPSKSHGSAPSLNKVASSRSFRAESSPHRQPAPKSALIDLLLPDIMNLDRPPSQLRSYPASIDLAAITNSSPALVNCSPPPSASGAARLLPPIGTNNARSQLPRTASASTSISLAASVAASAPTSVVASASRSRASSAASSNFPTASQIHETSTTEEIARFAESIINSEMKRPIVIRSDSDDTHDPKKKHKCPLCLARFQRPEHVKRHLKSHSLEKPFQCDVQDCGRRFNRKDNLKAHLKKIHGFGLEDPR